MKNQSQQNNSSKKRWHSRSAERVRAFVLTAALVFSMGGFGSVGAAQAADQPSGSGTPTDPYQIDSAADLLWFAKLVNGGGTGTAACAKLMEDINLKTVCGDGTNDTVASWTPIGNADNPYAGTFDGDGKTIEGLYVNTTAVDAGLFGYLKEGTVKNVTVEGTVTGSSKEECSNVGGIVGCSSHAAITNCTNTVAVTGKAINSSNYVGGIVGYSESDSTITGCTNTGTVTERAKIVMSAVSWDSWDIARVI